MQRAVSILACFAAISALVSTLGCGQVGSGPPAAATPATSSSVSETSHDRSGPPIVARISLSRTEAEREGDIEVVTILENRSPEPLVFTAEEFTSPNILLEVRDAMGERVLAAPPPVPSGQKRTIAPGKQAEIRMSLAGMFSPPLKPGAYNVRLRRVASTPHAFRILAK